MHSSTPHRKFSVFVEKAEIRLVLALAYVAALAATLIQALLKGKAFPQIVVSLTITHLIAMVFVAVIYYHIELLMLLLSPVLLLLSPIQDWRMRRYLRRFKQNRPAEVAIVLGHADWLKLEGWVKPIFIKSDIKCLVNYLKQRKQDFSFYSEASYEDVEKIMADTSIREVYFLGHGNSHGFELITGDILYYCEFNNPKYGKAFVHQVHCGTNYGKSLIDYVVPAENRARCFFFRKPINSIFICKEFKRRIEEISATRSNYDNLPVDVES